MNEAEAKPDRQPRPELSLAVALLAVAFVIVALGAALEDTVKLRRRGRDSSLVNALTAECRDLRQSLMLSRGMHEDATEKLSETIAHGREAEEQLEVAVDLLEPRPE